MTADTKRTLIASKLEGANRLLALAEEELETGMQALLSVRGDEKTLVTKVLADAFEKLREARQDVVELKKLLEEASTSS
jgi:hypothetical protein